MNFIKTYPAHQNRVTAIIFSLATEWVISTGHDKCVSWMCTRSGNMLGRHFFSSWASCLQYDFDTQYAFVGDYSGQITLLKLEQSTCSVITTLKGHEGSIACLWWDPIQRLLFSGASDNSVIMWDIGGRKGRTLLLQGHHDRVQALCYLQLTRQLVSCSSDGGIAVWNMDVSREEAPQWLESDSCQKCEQPFFWNIKQMWDTKTLGLRQHHCRKCGQAVCGKCSSKRSSYPVMGFEFQVRVCDSCYDSIKDEDRTSLATFHEGKHNISHMSMDVARGLMVTCGTDRVVKESINCIYVISPTLQTCVEITDKLADPSLSTSLVALPSKCILPVRPLFTVQLLLPRFSSLSSGLCQWPPNLSPSSCPYQPFLNMPVKTQL
ncbi:WD repeat and FYVE domain-containing protein 1 isoform X4 [Bos mutus]